MKYDLQSFVKEAVKSGKIQPLDYILRNHNIEEEDFKDCTFWGPYGYEIRQYIKYWFIHQKFVKQMHKDIEYCPPIGSFQGGSEFHKAQSSFIKFQL